MMGEANGEQDREQQQPHPPRGEEEEEQDEEEEEQRQQQPPQQRRHGQSPGAPRPSSGQQQQQQSQPPPAVAMRNVGYVGKHRLTAAISRLDQELQSLQEEMNELETMESASAACQEVITSTEGKPDPLLPITSGPENSSWDRWFQRVRSSRSNKWWASKGSDFS